MVEGGGDSAGGCGRGCILLGVVAGGCDRGLWQGAVAGGCGKRCVCACLARVYDSVRQGISGMGVLT